MVYIIFSFITIISMIVTCNKNKKQKGEVAKSPTPVVVKSDSSGSNNITPSTQKSERPKTIAKAVSRSTVKPDKPKTEHDEEDVFAALAKKLAKKEKTEQTESLKGCDDERNPLYSAQRTNQGGSAETVKNSQKKVFKKEQPIRTDKTQDDLTLKKNVVSRLEVTRTQKTEYDKTMRV